MFKISFTKKKQKKNVPIASITILLITFSYCKNEESNRGRGFWKFDDTHIEELVLY